MGLPRGCSLLGQKLAPPLLVVSAGVRGLYYFKAEVRPNCACGVLVKIVLTAARRCHSGVGQFGAVGPQNSGQHHPHISVSRFTEPYISSCSVVQLESAELEWSM